MIKVLLEDIYQIKASYKSFIPIPKNRRLAKNGRFLEINGASGNNLNNVNLKIPLGSFTCVT